MKFLPHVRIRQERFGSVIFDKKSEKFFVVDEIGNEILTAIQDGKSIDEIVQEFVQKYEASKEEIEKDVLSFVEQLHSAGLIE